MSARDNGMLFTLMAVGILAAGVHLAGNAVPSGSRGRRPEDDDAHDGDDEDDTEDLDGEGARMTLSNLRASRRHIETAIEEVEDGAPVPPWAADRVTRAQQHLGDVSGFLSGRRRS
jgi:hypothetical protein